MIKYINKKQTGFTIVEILIVIVVIGILAALVLNTFAQVQAKARNANRVSTAQALEKIIRAYLVTYDRYPLNHQASCLGVGYVDVDGDGKGDCWNPYNPELGRFSVNDAVNNEFKKVAPSLPEASVGPVTTNSGVRKLGFFIDNNSTRLVDGEVKPNVLVYYLEGNGVDCGGSNVVAPISGQFLNLKTGVKHTTTDGKLTSCYITLPNEN